jgi:hypothetical protein
MSSERREGKSLLPECFIEGDGDSICYIQRSGSGHHRNSIESIPPLFMDPEREPPTLRTEDKTSIRFIAGFCIEGGSFRRKKVERAIHGLL